MNEQPNETRQVQAFTPRQWGVYTACFALLLLFHVGMNYWWLKEDNHPIRTDEESHMISARAYYKVLFVQEYDSPLQRLIAVSNIPPSEPAHPPLLHLCGALLMRVCGYGPDVMGALNTLSFVAVLLGSLLILRRFLPPWHALYAVFVISFTPIIFASSRYFMTDYLSLAIVVWAFYCLLRCEGFMNTPWVFAFALLNGLGILARTTTFLYYLVPCAAVALTGLWRALRPAPGERVINQRLGLWIFNGVMTVVVTLGVFGPWYFKHLDQYYDYWVNRHRGGPGGPVALFQPDTRGIPQGTDLSALEKAAKEKKQTAAEKSSPQKTSPAAAAAPPAVQLKYLGFLDQLLHPRVPWSIYPKNVIQDAVFFPMFMTALAGMLIMVLYSQYRRVEWALVLLWLLGSWACMTMVMKYSTPRYTLQAMPALAMFAALAAMAPKHTFVRRITMGVFAAWLLFQYGNLTIAPYGPFREWGFYTGPYSTDPRHYREPDIVMYKDTLTLGFSYTSLSAPVKENFKDKIFSALLRAESKRPAVKGEYANFLRLNIRGMEFEQEHYWPGGSASILDKQEFNRDVTPPKRKFRSVGQGKTPEELLSSIDAAEYLVYAINKGNEDVEQQWLQKLAKYHFQLFERFQEKAFGEVPDRTYGILVRQGDASAIPVQTPEDVDKLNLVQLYQLRNTVGLGEKNPEFKAYIDKRFESMIQNLRVQPYPINESLTFISADASRLEAGWFLFRFIFKVNAPLKEDYRIYFHGRVAPENVQYLPTNFQKEGVMMWNFNPEPPTHSWPVNDYVIITHRIKAALIPYKLKLGFSLPGNKYFGSAIPLGEIDFNKIE